MGPRVSHRMSGMSPAIPLPITSPFAADGASGPQLPPPVPSSHVLLTSFGLLDRTASRRSRLHAGNGRSTISPHPCLRPRSRGVEKSMEKSWSRDPAPSGAVSISVMACLLWSPTSIGLRTLREAPRTFLAPQLRGIRARKLRGRCEVLDEVPARPAGGSQGESGPREIVEKSWSLPRAGRGAVLRHVLPSFRVDQHPHVERVRDGPPANLPPQVRRGLQRFAGGSREDFGRNPGGSWDLSSSRQRGTQQALDPPDETPRNDCPGPCSAPSTRVRGRHKRDRREADRHGPGGNLALTWRRPFGWPSTRAFPAGLFRLGRFPRGRPESGGAWFV